jgi:cytochrome c oxidase subunit 4
MSTPTAAPVAHEETVHGAGHKHPSDRNYMGIALFLGVLTALEVATYYVDLGDVLIPILMVMMVVKFAVVAGWFMHLRFDNALFRRLFVSGLVLAVLVYMAFLTAMQVFGDNTTQEHTSQAPPAAVR